MGSPLSSITMKTALLLSCLLMVVSAQFGDLLSSRPFAGGKRPKLCTDNSNPRCGDGSLPVCKDGNVVDTSRIRPCRPGQGPPSCQDGSNLQCADGAEIKRPKVCNDGTSPSCPDGNPPVCPDNTPWTSPSSRPAQEADPGARMEVDWPAVMALLSPSWTGSGTSSAATEI